VRLYQAIATQQGSSGATISRPEQVTDLAHTRDPIATKTIAAFGRLLWSYAGNLTLTYGAWDGVIMTGTLSKVLRNVIRATDSHSHFHVRNPYQRRMSEVPLGISTTEYAELKGAVQALRSYWA
jgi:glucokinase